MEFLITYFPLILGLMCLGAVAGFLAGLLGVGGGIVLVPGLYAIFSLLEGEVPYDSAYLMHVCVGTSLATIIPTGFSSARAHHKRGSVDLTLIRMIGSGVLIGVVCGSWLAGILDVVAMKMIFAGALLVLSVLMITGGGKLQADSSFLCQPFTGIAGCVIGCVSTLIGIGGATLSVPYMNMHQVGMHRAVGSASALGLVIAIPASLGFVIIGWGVDGLPPFSLGYVNLLAWICIIPVSVLSAPLGVWAAHKVSVKKLKFIFAIFVLVVAVNMWRKILLGG
ncbi:MAG: sulfite exporter TauE/SafE family protein [Alphaproteobacteria bacterium]